MEKVQNFMILASGGSKMPSMTTILIICVIAALAFSVPSILQWLASDRKSSVDTTQKLTTKTKKNTKKSNKVPSAQKASMSRKAAYNNVYLNSGKNKSKSKGKGKGKKKR